MKYTEKNLKEIFSEVEMRSYSGRGMYGDYCLAVDSDELEAAYGSGKSSWPDDVCAALFRSHQDSLGMGTIYYWPSAKVDPEESEED